jgi:hypothetical protein
VCSGTETFITTEGQGRTGGQSRLKGYKKPRWFLLFCIYSIRGEGVRGPALDSKIA